jgi:tRNA-splicing ligase RtcB
MSTTSSDKPEPLELERLDEVRWRIPRQGKMRVDGIVFADARMMATLRAHETEALGQVRNVACLPGIVGASMAMPDIHWGYGFPIGGVAAFGEGDGVVSPGGVGYDINCGVRLLRSDLARAEVSSRLRDFVEALFAEIPSGVGSHRRDLRLSLDEQRQVLRRGAGWCVEHGYGEADDLSRIEEGGCMASAQPEAVSARALERGRGQLGTLGSGNHFVEVDYVAEVFDQGAAATLGLDLDSVAIAIHTGSRGLGYQVCDDSLAAMLAASHRHGIELPDKQLCAAPLDSDEGRRYLGAMAAAANFAFANRQLIGAAAAETASQLFRRSPAELGLRLVYDVSHNIAKLEEHMVGGVSRRLCVHRKGATRAFPPGHPSLPAAYRAIGQPVLIPGDMGRCSYVLVGTARAMDETFGSSCHGAGRVLSRHAAKKAARGRSVVRELEDQGIWVRAASRATLVEEIPDAYKDVSQVVDIVEAAGLARKVAKLKPMAVIKG